MATSIPATETRIPQPRELDLWQHLVGATTDEAFCVAWLALLCRQMGDVTAGVVLLRSPSANTFTPVALWPMAPRDMSHLGAVSEIALRENRGVVQRAPENNSQRAPENSSQRAPENNPPRAEPGSTESSWHIAYPLGNEQQVLGTVTLEVPPCTEPQVHDYVRQLHWGLGLLRERLVKRAATAESEQLHRLGSVVEVIAASLSPAPLQETLFSITNLIARELGLSRAVLGLVDHGNVRVTSLSDAAWFERNTEAIKRYTAAMEEALDQLSVVRYDTSHKSEGAVNAEHVALARVTAADSIITVPLLAGTRCVGLLTVQQSAPRHISDADMTWLEALAGLLPSIIEQKRNAERGFVARLADDTRALLTRFFGPRHLVWKFCGSVALLIVAALVFVETDYQVRAKTIIEGEIQRAAVAPFEGFVAQSYVRAGDIVRKGQPLCLLEDRDLKLERDRWNAEREQHLRELREAMATHELTQVQIIRAQVEEAQAELALVEEKLARARVLAPFDGIVISGDLSQLIGSPVELGKKLFEIAPLDEYRVVLQVDETDIGYVRTGQAGHLLISGIAGDALPFEVTKVTPVATSTDGQNYFRVEAQLSQLPPNLRPGMQGVGKVAVGERRLWWILTHGFTDWLRLTLWKWMP
jgi:multidrug resistance efflux pump